MVRSLYKSVDMEEDLPLTWEPIDGFRHMWAHLGLFFMPNQMMRSLYISADMDVIGIKSARVAKGAKGAMV